MTEQAATAEVTPEQWDEANKEALDECLYRQWLILALAQASQPEEAR